MLSLLNGIWAVVIAYYEPFFAQPPHGAFPPLSIAVTGNLAGLEGALFIIGAILVLDSLISFVGLRIAFALGAVLSAAVIALVAFQWGSYETSYSGAAMLLSVACIVVDAVASRPAKVLSEQASPLNLPVFG